ncbi:glycosyltransferase family 4 protein [Carboxylicivirga linearis]|uniref:Glycosyltransferase family 4 protein n=1 Tax=Carboxylicivirga linearis TaxID=1628157 RepID=A0ABS5K165_9BACT|nr:glycosyltransferase family 4 protein [Carboxylicivirga linearis]MBS2100853.1 glycosyltransferase family 4 protein [Carboxylicivirga linearis]
MKIAILSSIAWRTPPLKYGPWEQVASNITEGLIEKGIEVTLFATGNSITKGKLSSVIDIPYAEDSSVDPKVAECLHISNLMEQADRFDIIHNNFDFLPLTYSGLIKPPILTTIHGFSSPKIIPVYKKYNHSTHYVSISDSDRHPELDYIATVYNGINIEEFTFNSEPDDYLLFFGRIHPDKGTYEAIEIAKKAKRKLIISGLIQDREYFDQNVKPYINNDDIIYVGNSGPKDRQRILSKAFALLHPIHFAEPFGLSVVEAMACGTPVIAFNLGSMSELILQNKTGFLVSNITEAVDAVTNVESINRHYCYARASSLFSHHKMIEGYLTVYEKILRII